MKYAVRILMWTHFVYLLLLPTLSLVATSMLFPDDDLWTVVLIAGFPPVVMYSFFLANGYTIPDSLPVALFVVLAIPLQIGLSILLFGRGSIWLFFAESAAVEIGAFVLGVMSVALRNRAAEIKLATLAAILILPIVLFVGGTIPRFVAVFYGYGGFSPWLIFFVTAFVTAFWDYTKVYKKLTTAFGRRKEPQNLEMRFDSRIAKKLFGVQRNVPLLSPVWRSNDGNAINKSVWIFAITAMFLPVIAGIITAIITGR